MIDAVNAFVLHLEEDGILHLEGFSRIWRTQENHILLAGSGKMINYKPRQTHSSWNRNLP